MFLGLTVVGEEKDKCLSQKLRSVYLKIGCVALENPTERDVAFIKEKKLDLSWSANYVGSCTFVVSSLV